MAPDCWNAKTEDTIPRKAKDIVDNLMPLFRLSKQIVLVDMHLYPGDISSKRVLQELLRRVSEFNYGKGVKRITVHSSDRRKDMQDSLELHLSRYLPSGFILEYRLWPESMEHDRFAVTDIGGIQLGHGFDEFRPGRAEKVFISLIGYEKRRSLLAMFSGEPTYRASIGENSDCYTVS